MRKLSRRIFLTQAAAVALAAGCRQLPSPQPTSTPPLVGFVTDAPFVAASPTGGTPAATIAVAQATRGASATSAIFLPAVQGQPATTPTVPPVPTATATPRPTPTPTPEPCLTPGAPPPVGERPLVGLHASADPAITPAERCTFIDLRPTLVKVMSFHPPEDIDRLARTQPEATWIVRTFLEFGGREVTPEEFVRWTLPDTRRTVARLAGRPVLVELHNEPNLVAEGWSTSWRDGAAFAGWWLDVLARYREALPGVPLLFPAVSPGPAIDGVRTDAADFLAACIPAIQAADGLGVHLYWSADFPLSRAFAQLDAIVALLPDTPLWITEASYNRGGISDADRADQYLTFVAGLAERPQVEGVVFFVASASNPTYAPETWVGKSIAPAVGQRDR